MIRYYKRSSNGYLCKKKITNRPIAASGIFMIWVIVEKDKESVVVHGPFYSQYGASVYKTKLESFSPAPNYKIQYLIPEKNLRR